MIKTFFSSNFVSNRTFLNYFNLLSKYILRFIFNNSNNFQDIEQFLNEKAYKRSSHLLPGLNHNNFDSVLLKFLKKLNNNKIVYKLLYVCDVYLDPKFDKFGDPEIFTKISKKKISNIEGLFKTKRSLIFYHATFNTNIVFNEKDLIVLKDRIKSELYNSALILTKKDKNRILDVFHSKFAVELYEPIPNYFQNSSSSHYNFPAVSKEIGEILNNAKEFILPPFNSPNFDKTLLNILLELNSIRKTDSDYYDLYFLTGVDSLFGSDPILFSFHAMRLYNRTVIPENDLIEIRNKIKSNFNIKHKKFLTDINNRIVIKVL